MKALTQIAIPQTARYVVTGHAALCATLLLLAMLLSTPVLAGVHPVPLEKNVDAKKCLDGLPELP